MGVVDPGQKHFDFSNEILKKLIFPGKFPKSLDIFRQISKRFRFFHTKFS